MKLKKIISIALLTSISICLSILDSFITLGIAGVKIGLANIVILLSFYIYSEKEALIIDIIRVFIVGLLYSGLFSFSNLLSISGVILSYLAMLISYKIKKENIYLVSSLGAMFHSIGQILVSCIILSTISILYYLLIILLISIPLGMFTAFITTLILKIIKKEEYVFKIRYLFIPLTIYLVVVSSFIFTKLYNTNELSTASITYQNELILEIDLNDPSKYSSYSETFISYEKDNNSYLYKLYVYNNDEDSYNYMIIEVLNGKIRVKEENCKNHSCSKVGFISTKFESIACIPNQILITIAKNDSQLDVMM